MLLSPNSSQPRYCAAPPFAVNNGKKETAAQAAGRRYEEKALPFLTQWALANRYEAKVKPWIQYINDVGQVRWCQPDFVAISDTDDNLIIVEVKLRHTRDAFKQLRFYKGIVAELHQKRVISLWELCRYFDRAEFPTELLPGIRPHNLPHAATIFEPREWTPAIN